MNLKEEIVNMGLSDDDEFKAFVSVVDEYFQDEFNKELVIKGLKLGDNLFSKVFFAGYFVGLNIKV